MNKVTQRPEDPAVRGESELARLNGQVEAMRGVLVGLLQDVVRAEARLENSKAVQLLEANEQLVVAALDAQTFADTAAGALDEAERSIGLDPLTGLPNRTLLLDRLASAIATAKRQGHRVALLFLDLNNFKQINDTFGHSAGDQALQLAADCLTSLVRDSDTVSRHGGDEFLILLSAVAQAADAALVAEKVNMALRSHSRIGRHSARLSASVGISIYPEDGEDAQTLIDRADAAMYIAKQQELGGFVFHADLAPGPASLPAPSALPKPQRLTHHELTIAEHERRNAQLREANEKLVLAALDAQELQAAAEDAQRQQAELLAIVANELGNPFAPIRLAAAMLGKADAEKALLPRAQAIIEQQAERMTRLAKELLAPERIDKVALRPQRRAFDLAVTVAEVVKAFLPAMDRRQQTLDVELPAGPIEVHGDPTLIAQALANLLGNATAYTHDGGRIVLSVQAGTDALVISVCDNGAGIEPQALAAIFGPFVREPRARAANEDGLGIGLTVVREIVEAHGGSVVATSDGIGRGSRFTISLPMGAVSANT